MVGRGDLRNRSSSSRSVCFLLRHVPTRCRIWRRDPYRSPDPCAKAVCTCETSVCRSHVLSSSYLLQPQCMLDLIDWRLSSADLESVATIVGLLSVPGLPEQERIGGWVTHSPESLSSWQVSRPCFRFEVQMKRWGDHFLHSPAG